jgi:hypothetical protein
MRTWSLIGVIDDNGHAFDAKPFDSDYNDPPGMVSWLRWLWSEMTGEDINQLATIVLHQPAAAAPSPRRQRVRGDLRTANPLGVAEWLYLVDTRAEQVVVYEATIHDRWLHHSIHPLRVPPMPPVPSGDAATTDRAGHWWRPATVSVDGLDNGWLAQVCAGEGARGLIVARLDAVTLADLARVVAVLDADRSHGGGLPILTVGAVQVTATWYAGSGHEQVQRIAPDADGLFIIGPHILPWILPREQVPAYDAGALAAAAPIRQWVSPDGFRAQHPALAPFRMSTVCAAVIALCPDAPAVIGSDQTPHVVWLVAPSHALMVTPSWGDGRPGHGGITLPRPLGGSWVSDASVVVLSVDEVAATCRRLDDTTS